MSEKEYDNTNRGAMFVNSYKEEGDNRPDFTGNVNVDGVDNICIRVKESLSDSDKVWHNGWLSSRICIIDYVFRLEKSTSRMAL